MIKWPDYRWSRGLGFIGGWTLNVLCTAVCCIWVMDLKYPLLDISHRYKSCSRHSATIMCLSTMSDRTANEHLNTSITADNVFITIQILNLIYDILWTMNILSSIDDDADAHAINPYQACLTTWALGRYPRGYRQLVISFEYSKSLIVPCFPSVFFKRQRWLLGR